MTMIGRSAKCSRARQGGSRLSVGISTALHTLKIYSTVKTMTVKTLSAAKAVA